jgi:hypothetical protein
MNQETMIFNAILNLSQREQNLNNALTSEEALKIATKLVDNLLTNSKELSSKYFPIN